MALGSLGGTLPPPVLASSPGAAFPQILQEGREGRGAWGFLAPPQGRPEWRGLPAVLGLSGAPSTLPLPDPCSPSGPVSVLASSSPWQAEPGSPPRAQGLGVTPRSADSCRFKSVGRPSGPPG